LVPPSAVEVVDGVSVSVTTWAKFSKIVDAKSDPYTWGTWKGIEPSSIATQIPSGESSRCCPQNSGSSLGVKMPGIMLS
jgi:hypothetical protein